MFMCTQKSLDERNWWHEVLPTLIMLPLLPFIWIEKELFVFISILLHPQSLFYSERRVCTSCPLNADAPFCFKEWSTVKMTRNVVFIAFQNFLDINFLSTFGWFLSHKKIRVFNEQPVTGIGLGFFFWIMFLNKSLKNLFLK